VTFRSASCWRLIRKQCKWTYLTSFSDTCSLLMVTPVSRHTFSSTARKVGFPVNSLGRARLVGELMAWSAAGRLSQISVRAPATAPGAQRSVRGSRTCCGQMAQNQPGSLPGVSTEARNRPSHVARTSTERLMKRYVSFEGYSPQCLFGIQAFSALGKSLIADGDPTGSHQEGFEYSGSIHGGPRWKPRYR
jgi:hypothetical protein